MARRVVWSVNYSMSIHLDFKHIIKAQGRRFKLSDIKAHLTTFMLLWDTDNPIHHICLAREKERGKERKRRRGEGIINSLFCSSSTWSEPRGPGLWVKQVRSVPKHLERSGTTLVAISSILILIPTHFLSFIWPHNSQVTLYHLHQDANIMSLISFWFIKHSSGVYCRFSSGADCRRDEL